MKKRKKMAKAFEKGAAKKSVRKTKSKSQQLAVYTQASRNKRELEGLAHKTDELSDRLEDSEIHINLLTRLVTTLCVEKMGMRIGVLKRLLKRIEKEAIRDSQIIQLESLYNLPHVSSRKSSNSHRNRKKDPWDDIS